VLRRILSTKYEVIGTKSSERSHRNEVIETKRAQRDSIVEPTTRKRGKQKCISRHHFEIRWQDIPVEG
jgi:hypothetical protein